MVSTYCPTLLYNFENIFNTRVPRVLKKVNKKYILLLLIALFTFSVQATALVSAQPLEYKEKLDLYLVISGAGADGYTHTYDGSAGEPYKAWLTIVADDVDGPGTGHDGEWDEVYVNSHFVGYLNRMGFYSNFMYTPGPGGNPGHITTTTFEIDPAWIEPNVPIWIDVGPEDGNWQVEIETSELYIVGK
jgi:hypothetical protein